MKKFLSILSVFCFLSMVSLACDPPGKASTGKASKEVSANVDADKSEAKAAGCCKSSAEAGKACCKNKSGAKASCGSKSEAQKAKAGCGSHSKAEAGTADETAKPNVN